MSSFALKIVTADGVQFDGQAEALTVRTITGDMGILAGHTDCVAPLGMGLATVVVVEGQKRYAACIGGMVSVLDGQVKLVPTTFEWADRIDAQRAAASEERAKAVLTDKSSSDTDLRLAEARLKRALIRKRVHEYK